MKKLKKETNDATTKVIRDLEDEATKDRTIRDIGDLFNHEKENKL